MIDFISAWLPPVLILLVFLGAGVALSRRQMKSYGQHVAEVKAINDELIAINRDMVAELREIKTILKDRT
jgi:hypothetical protein